MVIIIYYMVSYYIRLMVLLKIYKHKYNRKNSRRDSKLIIKDELEGHKRHCEYHIGNSYKSEGVSYLLQNNES